jgi:hypothetical protein
MVKFIMKNRKQLVGAVSILMIVIGFTILGVDTIWKTVMSILVVVAVWLAAQALN